MDLFMEISIILAKNGYFTRKFQIIISLLLFLFVIFLNFFHLFGLYENIITP